MKRTKTPLQPTRIMPKRGKARSRDTGEISQAASDTLDENSQKNYPKVSEEGGCSSTSKSPPVTDASNSNTSPLKSRKHGRKNSLETSARSVSSPPAEVSAAATDTAGRESPDLGCSICLGAVEDRAFTDACYHTFCFECLVEWSRVRAVCPLCKKTFHSIIHSFRSYDDYELYQVPTSYVSNVVDISSLTSPSPLNLSRAGRFWNSNSVTAPSHGEQMLAFRRRIYSHSDEMQLRGIWSSDGVVVPPPPQMSPAVFDCYPVMLERVRPWILRDITVLMGNGEVQTVATIVLDLLQHFSVTSEAFYQRLFPFLGSHTRRFLLELDAFARSPFDMTTYDARVVYTTTSDAAMPVRLSADHVEDISSGDDSDIEVLSPAMVAYSESSLSSRTALPSGHAVPDLLRYLQAVQQNVLLSFTHRPSYTARMDSPIPGPSGLAQQLLTDESDSVGSYATTRSMVDADVRSSSPMVLSDADSDVMVVDIDQSVHSPINISSGEEEQAIRDIREVRRGKKRRRKERTPREHRRRRIEREQTGDLTPNALHSEPSGMFATGVPGEPHLVDSTLSDEPAERNSEETTTPARQQENVKDSESANIHAPKRPSSRSSSAEPNEHSSKLCPSQPLLDDAAGGVNDSADRLFSSHPKRSRSASSVKSLPAQSDDDVKPPTCKKHVSGHKSSKQKARELVAEQSSSELVCDKAEKSLSAIQAGCMAGTFDLPDVDQSLNDCQSTADSVADAVSPICDGVGLSDCEQPPEDVAKTDLPHMGDQSNFSVRTSSADDPCNMSLDTALSDGLTVLAAMVYSDPVSPPALSAAKSGPFFNDPTARVSSCDLVQLHPTEVDKALENILGDSDDMTGCDSEPGTALVGSPACSLPDVNNIICDNASESSDDHLSTLCQIKSPVHGNSSVSDPCLTREYGDSISSVIANSSFVDNYLLDDTIEYRNEELDGDVDFPRTNSSSDSLDVVSAGSGTVSSTAANCDFIWTYSGPSADQPQGATKSRNIFPDGSQLIGPSVTDWDRSASSPASRGSVISFENLNSNIDFDDDAIAVVTDTDSSDSEVEFLETGLPGRQRCISISSSDSSFDICRESDTDDIESVSSDSDTLVLVDIDEPLSEARACCDEDSEALSRTDGEHNSQLSDNSPSHSPVSRLSCGDDLHHGENAAESLGESDNDSHIKMPDNLSCPSPISETASADDKCEKDVGESCRQRTETDFAGLSTDDDGARTRYETADDSSATEVRTSVADFSNRSTVENSQPSTLPAESAAHNANVNAEAHVPKELQSSVQSEQDMAISNEFDG